MAKVKVIVPIIMGILGIVLLATTIQDWQADGKYFTAQKKEITAELSVAQS